MNDRAIPPQARHRRRLLASTALSAALLASAPVHANPPALPPAATPQGGQVVGGQASIASRPGNLTITQSSARTAIDWQSFNVGAGAHVTFKQPNAQAIALNRVISNNPSIIAGRIDANGQIVLMNQSGVVFTPGSQVNAESLVVSTAGISAKNFMAGHMVFDAPPRPGARIVNDGTITMKQAGLAAFVAPQVINRGTITATLGHVILAGASTFTLDVSGDGLVSIDVTQAVRRIDLGGRTVDALVTNQGMIVANGGTVTLTAQALDGVIQQLLDVRGTVQADSVGQSKGAITIAGIGGDLQVAGSLLARGGAPGSAGGTIAVDATGAVKLAATARIDASGATGGGVVALGTDATRATAGPADTSAPKARSVSIAAGATIAADATQSGVGGAITLLSAKRTDQNGALSARGIGAGGRIETSSDGVISLSGTETVFSAQGHDGTILLDPATLIVAAGSPAAGSTVGGGVTTIGTDRADTSYIDPGILNALTGTVVLTASSLLSVQSAISMLGDHNPVTLSSGKDLIISNAVQVGGSLEIDAAGLLTIGGPVTAPNITMFDAGHGDNIAIGNNVTAGTLLAILAGGSIGETAGGYVTAPTLTSDGGTVGGDVFLGNAPVLSGQNQIGTLGGFAATGTLAIDNLQLFSAAPLLIDGPVNVKAANLTAGAITIDGGITTAGALALDSYDPLKVVTDGQISQSAAGVITAGTLSGAAGLVALGNAVNTIANLGAFNAVGSFSLDDTGSALDIIGAVAAPGASIAANGITIAAPVSMTPGLFAPNPLTLASTAGIGETGAGVITAGTVTASGGTLATDDILLNGHANTIDALAGLTTGGTFALDDTGTALSVTGALNAASATLIAHGLAMEAPISVTGVLALASDAGVSQVGEGENSIAAGTLTSNGGTITGGDVLLDGARNSIATLGNFAAADGFTLNDDLSLTIAGPFNAGSASIGAPALTITGTAAIAGLLAVASGGNIIETGVGALDAGTLTTADGSIGGAVALDGANHIATLAAFTAAGALSLLDQSPLVVTGPVSAAGIGLIDAGGLTLAGALAVGRGQSIDLVAGSLTDFGATLLAPDGTIALAPFSPGATLDFGGSTAGGLMITPGFATAVAASGAHDLILGQAITGGTTYSASSVLTEGALPSFTGTLDLFATTSITNTTDLRATDLLLGGGSIVNDGTLDAADLAFTGIAYNGTGIAIAPVFSGSFSQSAVFANPGNAIARITGLTAGSGGILLTDGATPTIAGTIAVASGAGLSIAADAIALDGGAFSAPAGTITFEPLTAGTPIAIGGVTPGTFDIGANLLEAIEPSAAALHIGNALSGPLAVISSLSLAIPDIVLAGNGIAVDAPLSATGVLDLESTGTIGQTAPISAASLIGAANGNVSLTATNAIGTLGNFSDPAGAFALTDAGALTIAGAVSATDVALVASDLALPGAITAGSIALSAGTGSIAGAGVLAAQTFTATAGTLALTGPNHILTLAALGITGDATFNDASPLTIAGPVSAAILALGDTGSITETGAITAATLQSDGTIGGNVALTGTNTIATLGSFAAAGAVALTDTGTLNVGGPFTAASATLAAGAIAIPGSIGTGALSLASASTITETGAIAATTLAASAPGTIALIGTNAIASLGTLTAGGDVTLIDGTSVALDGPITAPNLTLTAAGIGLNGSLTTGLLSLASTGDITGAGAITATTLTGSGGPLIALTGANTIATLGNVTATGSMEFADTTNLLIAGTLIAPQSIAFSDPSGTITETGAITTGTLASFGPGIGEARFGGTNLIADLGSLTATGLLDFTDTSGFAVAGNVSAATIALTSPGSITETGALTATSLTATAAALTLGGANAITTLGPVSVAGAAILNDAAALNIAGPVTAATLALGGAAGITESGRIDVGTLAGFGTLGGTLALTGTNSIAVLGTIDTTGSIALADTTPLTIAGTAIVAGQLSLGDTGSITEPGGITAGTLASLGTIGGAADLTGSNTIATLGTFASRLATTLDDSSALTITGPLDAASATLAAAAITAPGSIVTGDLSLSSPGIITTTGGITATTLSGNGGATVALGGPNQIGTIGTFITTGDFTLDDATPLLIAGSLTAPGTLTLGDSGAITETGGITAGTLASLGTIGGAARFTGTNTIAALGNFAASGDLTFADRSDLLIAGAVTAANATLATPGSITETGALATGTLAGTAAGIALTGNNAIASLGSVSVVNALLVNDLAPLTIAGPITATSLALGDSGAITETGGITAATLASLGTIGGAAALTGTNTIASLAAFAAGGAVALDDTTGLDITGPLTAPAATLTAASLTIPGSVTTGTLGLFTAGAITATGPIDTAVLLGRSGGSLALTGSNLITSLGSLTAIGDALITDQAPLTIAGPVTAPNATITAAAIGGAGTLAIAGTLALGATGDITATGPIDAATLISAGLIGGSVALTGTNTVVTLGDFAARHDIVLDDAAPLIIAGTLAAPNATLATAGLTIPGDIAVPGTVSLINTGSITETGTLDPALLTGSSTGPVRLTGTNLLATLGAFTVTDGGFTLIDATPLIVAGPLHAADIGLTAPLLTIPGAIATPGTLTLGGGAITASGAIDAALLQSTGALTGDARFSGADRIAMLGAFDDAGHYLTLNDTTSLTLAGPVTARAVSISAAGQLVLDGTAGGGLFIQGQTLASPINAQVAPRPGIDSVLAVTAGGAQQLVQTGTFTIDTGPLAQADGLAAQPNSLFMLLPSTGGATFADLLAPNTTLVLDLGGGAATGQMALHFLVVAGSAAGQTNFDGSLGNLSGQAAAHNGVVVPVPGTNYRFNACIIGSVNCTVLPIVTLPEASPLQDFDLGPTRRRQLDRNVRLPGVAAKDY